MDIEELLKKMQANVTVNGDLVITKHVEHEIGNVENGGVGIIVNNYTQPNENAANDGLSPQSRIENHLATLIGEAKRKQEGKTRKNPKMLLLPYRAAIKAGVVSDTITCEEFNQKYGTDISAASFSEWIRGNEDDKNNPYVYRPEEIDPLVKQFIDIKEGHL